MNRLSHALAARRSDEDGSMIIAIMVIMVATITMVGLVQAVQSTLSQSRTDQNRVNAIQEANAGVDQALLRVDSNNLPTSANPSIGYTPTTDPVTGAVIKFTQNTTVNNQNWSVTAELDPTGQTATWTVHATGQDASGRKRLAVATMGAQSLFSNAFFVLKDFYLTGEQSSPQWFRSSKCPNLKSNAPACDLGTPIPARLGANGTLSGSGIKHFADNWQGFTMFGYSTQTAANNACSGCPTGQVQFSTNAQTPYVPPVPKDQLGCPGTPGGGKNSAYVISGTMNLNPGDYYCPQGLNITGNLNVNGAGTVKIWVDPSPNGLSISGNVNLGNPTTQVQFFEPAKSDGSASSGSICGSTIYALLDTPGLSISCTGNHQPEIYGAVVAHDYGGTGNHFGFHWDADSQLVTNGQYTLQNWHECPVGQSTC